MTGFAVVAAVIAGMGLGVLLTWLSVQRSQRERERLQAEARQLAEQQLRAVSTDAAHKVEMSNAGIEHLVTELRQQLDGYQTRITTLETERAGAQARLQQQVESLAGVGAAMRQESQALRQALTTSSSVRGNWGEMVLKNLLDQCGLNEHTDYDTQLNLPDSRLRPDVVVHLASGQSLAIDAKASLSEFLAGLECSDEAGRKQHFLSFAQVLRGRARELAGKDYAAKLEGSLPFVVMFVPGEGAFRAALDADPGLCTYGQTLAPQVVLTSPATLFPMLALVAQDWQLSEASRNAQQLVQEVTEFGQRLVKLLEHWHNVGKALDGAGKAYNQALASFNARLLPQWRKLQELQAGWQDPPEIKPTDNLPQLPETTGARAEAAR
ncbi:MAG: DNA recombination protein RmuC [Terriglobales bacterium]